MTDLYIDADETQIYGQHAVRKIRVRVALLIPAFTEGMNYLATQLETATATVKHALETGRKAESGIRKGSRAKKPVKKRAVSLLGRFGKHLDAHERGAVDRKDYFVYDGTATGVGTGADNVLQAVVHISTKLSEEGCPVRDLETWLGDFRNMAEELAPVVEQSDNAKSDRREATPETKAAYQAWLQIYNAAKSGVECVLRLSGKLHLMKVIFHDLAVPANAKVTELPPEEPEEPAETEEPEAVAPAEPTAPERPARSEEPAPR